MTFTNLAYSAVLVAAGALGVQLVDDSTPVEAKTAPKVEIQKKSSKDVEVFVNGQRIKLKDGEPLEIKIRSDGKERVMKLNVEGDAMFISPDFHGMHDHFKELGQHFKDMKFDFDFDAEAFKKFGEEGFRAIPPMSAEERKAFEKEMEDLRIELKDLKFDKEAFKELESLKGLKFKFDKDAAKELERAEIELKAMKPEFDKMKVELRKIRPEMEKGMAKWRTAKPGDLVKTLTPEQKAKMKSKGFLVPSDLTPAQRELLPQAGQWTISIDQDGSKFEFRSK